MYVTILGVPCPGCKISEGGQAAPEPSPSLKVWPPVAHLEFIVSGYDQQLPSRFALVDALGRIVREEDVPANVDHFQVSISELASGLYIARLISGNEIEQARVIIEH